MTTVADTTDPQPADAPDQLLDLVREYGDECSFDTDVERHGEMARALLDRIAALLPEQPVQARSLLGRLLWFHACGDICWTAAEPPTRRCPSCVDSSSWRPLLVGGDPAHPDIREPRPAPSSILSQVMAELGADRPEDVVRALRVLKMAQQHGVVARTHIETERDEARAELQHHLDSVDRLAGELNEARAEVERLRGVVGDKHAEIQAASTSFLEATNKLIAEREWAKGERDEALAEVERLRDNNCESFSLLIEALEVENLTQALAEVRRLRALPPQPPDPLVLSLPTVPEGAVALVGKETGARYTRYLLTASWQYRDGQVFPFGHLLGYEGALRVEMAPPREPRTAAEIWREIAEDDREYLHGSAFYGELKAALDREAGLTATGDAG